MAGRRLGAGSVQDGPMAITQVVVAVIEVYSISVKLDAAACPLHGQHRMVGGGVQEGPAAEIARVEVGGEATEVEGQGGEEGGRGVVGGGMARLLGVSVWGRGSGSGFRNGVWGWGRAWENGWRGKWGRGWS